MNLTLDTHADAPLAQSTGGDVPGSPAVEFIDHAFQMFDFLWNLPAAAASGGATYVGGGSVHTHITDPRWAQHNDILNRDIIIRPPRRERHALHVPRQH